PVALAVDAHPDAVHGVREARGEAREDRGTAHERLDPRALLEERVEEGDDLERRRGTLVERPESLQELLHASPFLTSSTRRCDPTRGPGSPAAGPSTNAAHRPRPARAPCGRRSGSRGSRPPTRAARPRRPRPTACSRTRRPRRGTPRPSRPR